jgi:preprotein translocase subunit SecF
MELLKNTNFDFLGKKWPFIIASLILTAVGLGSLAVKGGPEYGIDFKGGALMYVRFTEKPQIDKIRSVIGSKVSGEIAVQEVTSGENEVMIGTELKDEKALDAARATMVATLAANFTGTSGVPAGRLDFHNAGASALADRMRGPLQRAGAAVAGPHEGAVAVPRYAAALGHHSLV